MKKLILCFMLLISIIFAERWMTIKYCNLRKNPNIKAEKITVLKPGLDVTRFDIYGDYKKVKVLSGDHKGKTGFMWVKLIKKTDNGYVCDKQGCSLRERPTKKSKRIAKVGGGRKLKVLNTTVTWYQIEVDNFTGWVYKTNIEDIDKK